MNMQLNPLRQGKLIRRVGLSAMSGLCVVFAAQAVSASAQDAGSEARLRKMEAEVRALQRQVFPGSEKVFSPEITQQGGTAAPAAGQPATTPTTDMLARLDSLEGQIARLTAQVEQNGNKISQIEAQLASAAPKPAPAVPASTPTPPPTPLIGPAAPIAPPIAPAVAVSAPAPPPPPAAVAPPPAPAKPAAAKPAAAKPAAAAPSAQRVAAVRAIVKPQTNDPGDDEYSYGFRLWEARFYPEAQQQLKLMVEKYPRHSRISFARNLLGRAFLDDGKPREAAQWFLQNYNANKAGERASDSLLLLAESMRRLNDTSRACIALAEFGDTYARDAAGRLKGQYDQTRSALNCN